MHMMVVRRAENAYALRVEPTNVAVPIAAATLALANAAATLALANAAATLALANAAALIETAATTIVSAAETRQDKAVDLKHIPPFGEAMPLEEKQPVQTI